MERMVRLVIIMAVSVLTMSFAEPLEDDLVGTYGVSASDPSAIRLMLNQDHTFSYQDFSIAARPIRLTGSWESSGRRVKLDGGDFAQPFHKRWKISKDGQIASSQKGMTFYRICKLN